MAVFCAPGRQVMHAIPGEGSITIQMLCHSSSNSTAEIFFQVVTTDASLVVSASSPVKALPEGPLLLQSNITLEKAFYGQLVSTIVPVVSSSPLQCWVFLLASPDLHAPSSLPVPCPPFPTPCTLFWY